MKPKVVLLTIAACALLLSGLLLFSIVPFADATGHGAMLPVATNEATPVPATVPVADKNAVGRELATRAAAHPSATIYWPYPTPTGVFTSKDWPPDIPYQAAGAGYILTGGYLGLSSSTFKDTNGWLELLPDRVIRIHAGGGGYAGDPTQGLLVISVNTPAPHRVPIGPIETYPTPTKAGPVTITDAVGERLTLEAPDGTHFYFDVPTRRWVNP